jgi:hypothetical protein
MTGVAAQLPFASHPGTATVGRTQKYSNHHHSDYSYLLNVCSTPELGHTLAILWGWPFVFGMTPPSPAPATSVESWAPAMTHTKGFRSPGLNAITR